MMTKRHKCTRTTKYSRAIINPMIIVALFNEAVNQQN